MDSGSKDINMLKKICTENLRNIEVLNKRHRGNCRDIQMTTVELGNVCENSKM